MMFIAENGSKGSDTIQRNKTWEEVVMEDILNYWSQMGPAVGLIWLVVLVFYIYVQWRIFEKAGLPGWGVIIPIYNIYLTLKVAKRPGWWLILFFIPIVNLIIAIIIPFDIAKNFKKDPLFGAGLLFLGFIFYPVLAFGKAKYVKTKK